MKISDIAKATKGTLISGDASCDIDSLKITTDSRTMRRGDLFIALKGANFDGAQFVGEAFKKGAIGAIVESAYQDRGVSGKVILKVKDTTTALQDIARLNRARFSIPVICVTGSNGKTATKEMMSCALSSRYNVLKNEGTKNNHIGVPQTLLKLTGRHKICILELGTNHPGEIKALARIAAPDVAVITNIGPSHLEGLESLDGVFREKMGIAAYLKRGGSLILNGDDKFLKGVKKGRFRITRFGFGASNDFRASDLKFTKIGVEFSLNGKYDFRLSALGAHNVYNALAAIAVARHFGIAYGAIGRSLSKYAPPSMRLNLYRVRGVDIIDDSYNSNPLSMSSALDVLRSYPGGAKWVVSADMLELGRMSEFFHRSIGEAIAGLRVQGLLTLGELSRHTHMEAFKAGMRGKARHCSSHEEIADILRKSAKRGDVILVKGSRGMKMEEVVKRLRGRR